MSEKLTYNVIFREQNSFSSFQKSPMAATIQPLYLMPYSRVKVYELTKEEVDALKNNPFVKAIEPTRDRSLAQPELDWIQQGRWCRGYDGFQTSGPYQNNNPENKNWALWRCYSGDTQLPNGSGAYWGTSSARVADDRTEFSTLTTGTLDISASGKNVDIVIVDGGHVPPHMFEFQKNSDGTGGSRVIEYNWNQHWEEITGIQGQWVPPTDYSSDKWGEHATLVASHAAGNTQGWARDANIYTFSISSDWNYSIPSPMDYIAAFHRNKPINPVTGRKNPTIINNSWSYRISGWGPWDFTTELWDQAGTRLMPKREVDEQMSYYSPCITSPASQDPYLPGQSYRPPLKPLKNKLLDAPGEITKFAKYQITTTSDLSGAQILTLPTGWTSVSFAPKPFYKTVSQRLDISATNSGRSFVVQAPCQVSLYLTLDVRYDADITLGSVVTEIKVYRGSTLVKTVTGPAGRFSYATLTEEFTDNSQYTITYKSINVSAPTGAVMLEDGSITVTNHDFTCVKTSNFHGEAENIEADNEVEVGQVNFPDDFNWQFFGYKIGKNGFTSAIKNDMHGIKFSIPSSEWVGSYYTPRILLGRLTWEDSDYAPWETIQHITTQVTGSAGSRQITVKTRHKIDADYSIQDWSGVKYIQVIYKIYENIPNYLEIEIGENTAYVATAGSYPWTSFESLGWISNQLSVGVESVLASYEAGIDQGVITCGSAGNNKNLISNEGHDIHANKARIINDERGIDDYVPVAPIITPGGAGGIDKSIAVGAIENSSYERIAWFSSRGPGAVIWAPGSGMFGATYDSYYGSNVVDPRSTTNNKQYLTIGNGTSFSSPTVCGMMALIAEKFPYFTQKEMRDYLIDSAGKDQIIDPVYDNDKWGKWSLRDSPNNYLRYREERQKTGTVTPTVKRSNRPESGVLYPRRRSGKK
jgi:Subtilase family